MDKKAIYKLHKKAMDLVEVAYVEKFKGNINESTELNRQALKYERQAAELLKDHITYEPTRSVYFRSAASLAMDCNDFREAERLIATALSGNPPNEIAEELRDLLEQVNFNRHLRLRGIVLDPSEFQMSLTGDAVSSGVIEGAEFYSRINEMTKLIHRTAERKRNIPYRDRGPSKKEIKEGTNVFLAAPRAACFAVTIKVGRSVSQQELFPNDIIDELLSCLDLYNESKKEELAKKIPDEAYHRNFISIAKNIVPDGNSIKFVGFTTIRDGKERTVALDKPKSQIQIIETDEETSVVKIIILKGTIKAANDISSRNIKIVTEENEKITVSVPTGMMNDIVRPLWGERVIIKGKKEDKTITLLDIDKDEE